MRTNRYRACLRSVYVPSGWPGPVGSEKKLRDTKVDSKHFPNVGAAPSRTRVSAIETLDTATVSISNSKQDGVAVLYVDAAGDGGANSHSVASDAHESA